MYIYIHKYRKDKKDRPRNCVLLCVTSLKACIRRMIENKLSCKLSKRMYYYTRKRCNHFYQCFIQFYIILIQKFVVSRSFKIRFCSDLFGLSTLRTVDPSDHWPFGIMNWHALRYKIRSQGLVSNVTILSIPRLTMQL